MSNSNNDFFGAIGILLGLGTICFFGWQSNKMYHTAKKLDLSIDDIASKQTVDIQEAIVNKAIEKAVNREVAENVRDSVSGITRKIRSEMVDAIRKDVKTKYKEICDETSAVISKEVARLDIQDLKDQVKDEAKDKILEKLNDELDGAASRAQEKFDGKFDELLDSYTSQLSSTTKIYDTIADKLTKKFDGDPTRELLRRII